MDADIDKAISAAGLVLAVLTALYTLWLPTVSTALAIRPDPDKDNRGDQKSLVLSAVLTKGLPLAAASGVASGILFARFCTIVADAWQHRGDWQYDDVKALLVLTYVLLVTLTIVAMFQLVRLVRRRIQLG